MKKSLFLILFIVSIISSCKKDKDEGGEAFKKEDNIIGKWESYKIKDYIIHDDGIAAVVKFFVMDFHTIRNLLFLYNAEIICDTNDISAPDFPCLYDKKTLKWNISGDKLIIRDGKNIVSYKFKFRTKDELYLYDDVNKNGFIDEDEEIIYRRMK
ncbi:MAG: hypothetical protein ACEPOV_12315 [Hyphomicrobiales bacterium]